MKILGQLATSSATQQAGDNVKDTVPSRLNPNWLFGSYDERGEVYAKATRAFRAFEATLGQSDSLESLSAVYQLGTWMNGKNPGLAALVVPGWVFKRSPEQEATRRVNQAEQDAQDAQDRIRDFNHSRDAGAKRT